MHTKVSSLPISYYFVKWFYISKLKGLLTAGTNNYKTNKTSNLKMDKKKGIERNNCYSLYKKCMEFGISGTTSMKLG